MASRKLNKVLTTPSKVASALNWRGAAGGSVLNLDIHQDSIEIAVASHPLNHSVHVFPSMPRTSYAQVQKELFDIVRHHNVCGFVVSWPVQPDTGNPGASCGRTLHTLDELLKDQSTDDTDIPPLFTPNRPICLWDGVHTPQTPTDSFGRNPVYARTSSQKECRASKERYHSDENIEAVKVWEDFVRSHWPNLQEKVGIQKTDCGVHILMKTTRPERTVLV